MHLMARLTSSPPYLSRTSPSSGRVSQPDAIAAEAGPEPIAIGEVPAFTLPGLIVVSYGALLGI